ncbi:MAG: hypothetical protein NVS1B13_04880 [Flavisolibacter sp.]
MFLYTAALILCNKNPQQGLTYITLSMAVFTLVQALGVRYFWPSEKRLQKVMGTLSLAIGMVFISMEWKGFSVTLLWLVTSVLLFVIIAWAKSVSFRMASIVVMAITLFKLVIFDSMSFTTIEKVISYLSIGVLLLLVSFFYQKFKDQLFEPKDLH